MGRGPSYNVSFRRRREGKTDYRSRLALLKSRKVRAVVRRSLSGTSVQIVRFADQGDQVVTQASYKDLSKMGWKHSLKDTSAAYLVGLLAGKRAEEADIKEAVLDIGLNEPVKGSNVFSTLKGLIDSGIEIPHGKGVFPEEDRIMGRQKDIKGFEEDFETIKNKIMEMGS